MNALPQTREACKLDLAAEILRCFSEVRFVALGTSMLPVICPGDCLTVEYFGAAAPRCGDIVLCRRADEFRVHRIVRVLDDGEAAACVLRGDALTHDDPPVPIRHLLGRVTSVVRRGKPVQFRSLNGFRHLLLRAIVRRSNVAVMLLLRWQAMQARDFLGPESLPATSVEARTEFT